MCSSDLLPESWRIPVTQGFMAAFKLSDPRSAAVYYGLAASRPGAPDFLKDYAAKLAGQNGLSITDLQSTLDRVLNGSVGSKFGDYLKSRQKPGYEVKP